MEYFIAMSEDNRVSATGEITKPMGKDARPYLHSESKPCLTVRTGWCRSILGPE